MLSYFFFTWDRFLLTDLIPCIQLLERRKPVCNWPWLAGACWSRLPRHWNPSRRTGRRRVCPRSWAPDVARLSRFDQKDSTPPHPCTKECARPKDETGGKTKWRHDKEEMSSHSNNHYYYSTFKREKERRKKKLVIGTYIQFFKVYLPSSIHSERNPWTVLNVCIYRYIYTYIYRDIWDIYTTQEYTYFAKVDLCRCPPECYTWGRDYLPLLCYLDRFPTWFRCWRRECNRRLTPRFGFVLRRLRCRPCSSAPCRGLWFWACISAPRSSSCSRGSTGGRQREESCHLQYQQQHLLK